MFYLIFIAAITFMWGVIVVLSFVQRRTEHPVDQEPKEQPDTELSLPVMVKHFQNSIQ